MNTATNPLSAASLDSMLERLKNMPTDALSVAKATLFEESHQFKTLDDVVVPEELTAEVLSDQLIQFQNSYQETVVEVLSDPQSYDLGQSVWGITPLAELSGNAFVTTPDKQRMYVEHVEFLKSINPSQITKDNASDVCRKICFSLLQTLQAKTVTI